MTELCTNSIASNSIAASAPCLTVETPSARHICLDTKPIDSQLKSYDNSIDTLEEDEFFLVQYPSEVSNEVTKSYSEPNVLAEDCQNLQKFERSSKFKRRSYRKCLNEYYNDYQDCLEALGHLKSAGKSSIVNTEQETTNLVEDCTKNTTEQHKAEMSDEEIFTNIVLPIKNRSAPDILDTSFVTMTYDPGPYLDVTRRKSAFVFGEQGYNETSDMTVIRPVDSESQTGYQFNMLQKHWGNSHTVKVYREHGKSLGISIVGGKVDFTSAEKTSDVLSGIFVKNVVPDSPAGRTGQFKTGDRILEVSGIDLRKATHETAVQAIKKADNPVTFVIQSLIPLKNDESQSNVTAVRRQSTKSRAAPPPPSKSPSVKKRSSLKSPAPPPPVSPSPTENLPSLVFSNDNDVNQNTQSISNHLPAEEKSSYQTPGHSPLPHETAPSISETLSDDDDLKKKNKTAAGSVSDSESESDDDDVRELEGRTMSAKGQQIDRASAANVKRSKEEAKADPEEEDDFGYTMSESFLRSYHTNFMCDK
nr:unnamed protein product [Callosobruchus chinensis]